MSKGGAIYAGQIDGGGPVDLTISAKDKDCVFSGNRVEVTQVDENNKALDGYANALWVAVPYFFQESLVSLKLDAQEGRTIEFFDPIVVEAKAMSSGEQHDVVFHGAEGAAGKVVFSGKNYQNEGDNDLSRMSRFSSTVGITQEKGRVVITDRALVGASMDSTTEATAEVGALNYVQKSGSLEISNGGKLMVGSYIVGDRVDDSGSGFGSCVLSAGSGAELTTGWMFIENGVTFDLKPYDASTSGLIVKIVNGAPNSLVSGTSIYDENSARISLGGTLGIANNLNYTEARWGDMMEFLLFDFTSLTDKTKLVGEFSGIEITGTGSSRNSYGEWSLKWDDGETVTKDRLYAVWTPGGSIPEPASSALVMLGLCSLMIRRKRFVC